MVTTTQNRPPTPDADTLAAIAEIAAQLGEKDVEARRQIGRAVHVIGAERTRAFAAQALAIEASGGLMLPDGSRRHTVGGIFFRLMRDELMADEVGRQAAYRIFRPQGRAGLSEANSDRPARQDRGARRRRARGDAFGESTWFAERRPRATVAADRLHGAGGHEAVAQGR